MKPCVYNIFWTWRTHFLTSKYLKYCYTRGIKDNVYILYHYQISICKLKLSELLLINSTATTVSNILTLVILTFTMWQLYNQNINIVQICVLSSSEHCHQCHHMDSSLWPLAKVQRVWQERRYKITCGKGKLSWYNYITV
jgi:hypothetical protein